MQCSPKTTNSKSSTCSSLVKRVLMVTDNWNLSPAAKPAHRKPNQFKQLPGAVAGVRGVPRDESWGLSFLQLPAYPFSEGSRILKSWTHFFFFRVLKDTRTKKELVQTASLHRHPPVTCLVTLENHWVLPSTSACYTGWHERLPEPLCGARAAFRTMMSTKSWRHNHTYVHNIYFSVKGTL